jgi:hypothetical protein
MAELKQTRSGRDRTSGLGLNVVRTLRLGRGRTSMSFIGDGGDAMTRARAYGPSSDAE